MRQLGKVGKIVLAAMAGIIITLPMSSAADSVGHGSSLDSRTVPHPEWAQISGQIERTSTVGSNNEDASLRAIIRLSEGGHVMVDFGTAAGNSFQPKTDDFIHVRGEAIEKEGQLTVIAREVYAKGQVFRMRRRLGKSRAEIQENCCRHSALRLLLLVNAESASGGLNATHVRRPGCAHCGVSTRCT